MDSIVTFQKPGNKSDRKKQQGRTQKSGEISLESNLTATPEVGRQWGNVLKIQTESDFQLRILFLNY